MPGADLQRALVAVVELGAEQLAQLAEHLRLADLAEVDAPLGVVALGGDVVVTRVDVADLVGCAQRRPWRGADYPVGRDDRRPRPARPAAGVPPLELTGERTLPDVPAENYWYRRHLAVYEWIGARVIGQRVLDMACGEGYGSDGARPRRRERGRRRRQPRGARARAAALRRAEPALRARAGREPTASRAATTRSCSCRRSSTSRTRSRCCATSARCCAAAGVAYISTPNLLTLAPAGAREVRQPVAHQGVPRPRVRRAVPGGVRPRSSCSGCSTPASCAPHALALSLGLGRASTPRLRPDQAVL